MGAIVGLVNPRKETGGSLLAETVSQNETPGKIGLSTLEIQNPGLLARCYPGLSKSVVLPNCQAIGDTEEVNVLLVLPAPSGRHLVAQ